MLSEEEIPQDGMGTMTTSEERRMTIAKEMASLQGEVDDSKLVNTLLTIIMEEADGGSQVLHPCHLVRLEPASQCESTLITQNGLILATGRARLASDVKRITSSTSL